MAKSRPASSSPAVTDISSPADAAADSSSPAQEIHATQVAPNIECPFTAGCRGRVRTLSDIETIVQDQETKGTFRVRRRQYWCPKCRSVANGVHETTNRPNAGARLLNRQTARLE